MNNKLEEAIKDFDKQLARIEDMKEELHSLHVDLFNLKERIYIIGANSSD